MQVDGICEILNFGSYYNVKIILKMDEQGLVETLNAGSRKKKRKDRSEYRKT